MKRDTSKHKMLPGCHMPQIVNDNDENSKGCLERGSEELEGVSTNFETLTSLREPHSSPSDDEDVDDGTEEESLDETDYEDGVEQNNKKSEQVSSDSKTKETLASGVLTEPCSSPSSDEDEQPRCTREAGSSLSEIAGSERAEAVGGAQQGIVDEFTAYEEDILLVNVMEDDPELFGNLPQGSLLKLGPTRVTEAPKTRSIGVEKTLSVRIDGTSREFAQR